MKTPEEIKKGLECDDCKKCPYSERNNNDGENHCGEIEADALSLIQQLEAQMPQWISVEERLPEIDGKYIVCTSKQSVYFTKFMKHGKGGDFQTDIYTHITHWMPLPKPPEEEEV